jgi:hypothetical protein
VPGFGGDKIARGRPYRKKARDRLLVSGKANPRPPSRCAVVKHAQAIAMSQHERIRHHLESQRLATRQPVFKVLASIDPVD